MRQRTDNRHGQAHRAPSLELHPEFQRIKSDELQMMSTMQALVYDGPGRKALEDRPKPTIQAPTDAIVRITKTTICGTDLHILKGDVATCTPGTVLGHEGVGIVDAVGAGVTTFKPGDRVLISCISACGRCDYCRKGMYSHCTTGGWILGNTHRRHAGRVRAHSACRHQPVPDSRRAPTKKRWSC